MKRNYFNLIIIILFAGGCTPYYHSLMRLVKFEAPAKFAESETGISAVKSAPNPAQWWLEMDDERLNDLMVQVLAHNLDIDQAEARYQQAFALAKKAGAAAMPGLSLIGNANRAGNPGVFSRFTGNNYKLSVAASYEVDFWGRIDNLKKAAHLGQMASAEDLHTVMIGVTAQAADLYFMVVEQQVQLDLALQEVDLYYDMLERVERRYVAGLAKSADVYQARQNLMAAKVKLPGFKNSLGKARHALAVLAGKFPVDDIGYDRSRTAETTTSVIDDKILAGLDVNWLSDEIIVPAQLLKKRPDIRAAYLRLEAQDAKTAAAVADRFPAINLSADLGWSQIDSILGTATGIAWNMAVNAKESIFDGGSRQAEVERNKAVFQENLAYYQQVVLKAFQEVEDALLAIRSSKQQIHFLTEKFRDTTTSLAQTEDRYNAGLTDYLPIIPAKLTNLGVLSQIVSAKRQLISERISLMRATAINTLGAFPRKNVGAR